MNRTDRLYAMVETLRARAPGMMRAAELADRFEVSTRTVERDLLALQYAGVPIWTRPGPGGGYGLDARATLPPLNLTPEEAAAVATALIATQSMPLAAAGQSALTKLAGVMGSGQRARAEQLVSQVRIATSQGGCTTEVWEGVQRALAESVALRIGYRDADGAESQRTVEPAGIVGTQHGWYLFAWCRLRDSPRAFRLDRIGSAVPTTEGFEPRSLDEMVRVLPFSVVRPTVA